MVKLIDADNAISVCEILSEKGNNPHYWDQLISIIENMPAVDAAPVMHGQWEHRSGDEWWCTICGHVVHTDGSWEHPFTLGKKYCDNCGAKMDGGDEGETGND